MRNRYPRNLVGYSNAPPFADWPGGARLALQFVLNYEEGGESCVLHGDAASEFLLTDIANTRPLRGARNLCVESNYEYGTRVGVWRLLALFERKRIPLTVFAVAMAASRNPDVIQAMVDAGHEIASHGYRWIDYHDVPEEVEREHIAQAVALLEQTTGQRPLGWYTGRMSPNTRRLLAEYGGFMYDADAYDDDLPYWIQVTGRPHLVVPYTLDANDMRFSTPQGFNSGEQFYTYLKDSFDVLLLEGEETPRMMSVGLHCRLVGRPGRAAALERFLDYAREQDGVWFARRIDIARHWRARHPFRKGPRRRTGQRPSELSGTAFIAKFGQVFDGAPWIAEAVAAGGLTEQHDTCDQLHGMLCEVFRHAPRDQQLAVVRAHGAPGGNRGLAADESRADQKGTRLASCLIEDSSKFVSLTRSYSEKFDFPFILAVEGRTPGEIISTCERRLANPADVELRSAMAEIERIAWFRLAHLLGEEGVQ